MTRFAEPMARLIDELRKLPGVGTKSAQRFAFHLLRASDDDANALAAAIRSLREHLRLCSLCNNVTDIDPCNYCTSPTRNPCLLCIVEEPTNIAAIERTRSFNGLYHVLHGTLSPVNGIGPDQLRLRNLWPRLVAESRSGAGMSSVVEKPTLADADAPQPALSLSKGFASETWNCTNSEMKIEEVILATSPTVEGEATARWLLDEIRRAHPGLRISRIATGVPAGSDIEYADEVTMTRALEGRREW